MKESILFLLAAVHVASAQSTEPAPAPVTSTAGNAPTSAPADAPEQQPTTKPLTDLPRESQVESALTHAISGSAFGGYGEITLNAPSNGEAVIDFRRFVLFFGHDFSDHIRFYSELEVEHAVASSSDAGEAEVEQGYLDGLFGTHFNLRGGLILMPMGIVNVYHEPPSFNGVDRPDVDQFVIPSTWREPGVGVFGELGEAVRYQLYVVNGFNANGFTAAAAIHDGHQEAQLAHAADIGAIARVDYEPVLGTVVGASAYGGTSGNSLGDTVGHVPLGMFDIDARYHHTGVSARAEIAVLLIGDTAALNTALAAGTMDQMAAGPVAARSQGAYLEVGYDILRMLAPSSDQALDVFTRFDYADTQAKVLGLAPLAEFDRKSQMMGVTYHPIAQVALKLDYRRHWLGSGESFNEFASAITWLF